MHFGFLKDDEKRVSITPSTCEKFFSLNHQISIEKSAGLLSGFSDKEYKDASITSRKEILSKCDIIICVNSSSIS